MIVICKNCNKLIERRPAHVRKQKYHFCNRRCFLDWAKATGYLRSPKNKSCSMSCSVCAAPFKVYSKYNAQNPTCSRACANVLRRRLKLNLKCDFCGIHYKLAPSAVKWKRIRRYKKHYCSRKCQGLAQRGSGSPVWVADRNKLCKRRRITAEFKEWRETVFARDNWTCLWCDTRGVRLEPHHIKRWHDFPALRYDIENGITLCVTCHNRTKFKEAEIENMLHVLLDKHSAV